MKARILLAVIVIILVFTIIAASIFTFDKFQSNKKEIPQRTPQGTPSESLQTYLMVGSKHVPIPAIEVFDRYNIHVELTQEEREQITPLEDFFIMGSNIPKDIDKYAMNPNDYKLSIIGDVEHPITLSYEDILTQFEIRHMVTELYCMPSLTGIGKFSGPSLYDIISYAKPTDEDVKIIFIAADGYEKGWSGEFPLNEIKDHREDFLLAIAMNGYPLAIEHGYPARLALASKAGALWVKWLSKIVIVPEDAARGEHLYQLSYNLYNETGIKIVETALTQEILSLLKYR